MIRNNRSREALCAVAFGIFLVDAEGPVHAIDVPVTWDDGGSTHNWTDAANWDPDTAGGPGNAGILEFLVTIGCTPPLCNPAQVFDPVIFNAICVGGMQNGAPCTGEPQHQDCLDGGGVCAPPVEITDFFLRNNSRLVLNLDTALTVLRSADIAGIIDGRGGDFTACGTNVAFTGCRNRVFASDGSVITTCAPTFCSAGLGFTTPILSADGKETVIDLSTVTSLSTAFNDNSGGTSTHTITATNGGVIDLSALPRIEPPVRREDIVLFTLSDNQSTINLGALHTISGAGGRTQFVMSNSAVQNLPALTTIEDVHFLLSSGAQLHVNGSAASYSSVGLPFTTTILSADGVSADGLTPTLLDLSAVTSLSTAFNDNSGGTSTHTITATNGGVIDLSALPQIEPPLRGEDFVRVAARGAQSEIDLRSLGTVSGGGRFLVEIADGAHIQMGNINSHVATTINLDTDSTLTVGSLQADSPVAITMITESDLIDAAGSLLLGDQIAIFAHAGGTVRIGGDFLYKHTETAKLSLGLARVECVGDWQWLEVGGSDFDLQWQFLPDANFGFQQLTIGEPSHSTVIQLVDLVDNHQPRAADALYLFGIEDDGGEGGMEGLRILGGSTLVIGNLNVYALLDVDGDGVMERTRLHDLFEEGEMRIRFDHNGNDGFIVRSQIIPPIGAIDARQPSNLDGSNPDGWTSLELVFFDDPAQLDPADFVIEVTGGTTPAITGLSAGTDKVTVELDRPIPVGERTKVTHLLSGSKTCVGYLPADVNGDGTSSSVDILAVVDCLNGIIQCAEWQADVNRSELPEASDILRVVDLLNGAGAFDPMLNRTLPDCP